jgi:hypothetical protein
MAKNYEGLPLHPKIALTYKPFRQLEELGQIWRFYDRLFPAVIKRFIVVYYIKKVD